MIPTGTLEAWKIDPQFPIIWGYVYNDRNERFVNGTWIHTSAVKREYLNNAKEGNVIPTRNSYYRLGKPSSV